MGRGMTFMLLASLLLSVSTSELLSQPMLQVQRYRRMRERFWQKSQPKIQVERYRKMREKFWQKSINNNDENILEKISEQDMLEKEAFNPTTTSLNKNVRQHFWQKQNVSPDRFQKHFSNIISYGWFLFDI